MQPSDNSVPNQLQAPQPANAKRWVKPLVVSIAMLSFVGLGIWAFLTFYWNANEQVLMRILDVAASQPTILTNSTMSMKYKDLDISADIDFATDGPSAQLGFDGEVRYGSNRYDTAAALVGDKDSYMLRLRNPRQFMYDLSGVYATVTQTDGMYDNLSDKLDDKWLELDDKTVKDLVGTNKLTKALSCTARSAWSIRSDESSRREFVSLFKLHPFLSISSGRDDVVSSIPARTYVLSISKSELSAFIDSYASSEVYKQASQCYGQDLKQDLEKAAQILQDAFSFSLSVSKSSLRILKLTGSVSSKPYSLVFETVFSQETMGTITKPRSEVKLEDIDPYLQPIIIWLDSQRVTAVEDQASSPLVKPDATVQP